MISLMDRDVAAVNAERLAREHPADLIIAWCRYAGRQRHMGPGALVDSIRTGTVPPAGPHRPSTRDQGEYGHRIADWLRTKMPEICDERGAPHYAAIVAVIRIHYEHGKGSITVREHGPVIRAAVHAARTTEPQQEVAP